MRYDKENDIPRDQLARREKNGLEAELWGSIVFYVHYDKMSD